MRVLVTWGSKHGGTAGIGRIVGEVLAESGFEVVSAPAEDVPSLAGFDAVIVGGAIYANRWAWSAQRFVNRHLAELRKVPVWFFSSGPLDDSADCGAFEEPSQVAVLAERVGARGRTLFGGRLLPDAKGFPASAMAKASSGDWRNPDRVRAWTRELAAELPAAVPGRAVDHPARAPLRLLGFGVAGWALCALTMAALVLIAGLGVARVIHAIVAPLLFGVLAWAYFRARGAHEPLPTAVAWTALVALLDLVIVAGLAQRSLEMFASIAETWLPLALIFLATLATGYVMSMMPAGPRAPKATPGAGHRPAAVQ